MFSVPVDYKRSLFSYSLERNARDTQMTTRVPVVNGVTARFTVLAGKTARVNRNIDNLLHYCILQAERDNQTVIGTVTRG